jgi:hypothetical protein
MPPTVAAKESFRALRIVADVSLDSQEELVLTDRRRRVLRDGHNYFLAGFEDESRRPHRCSEQQLIKADVDASFVEDGSFHGISIPDAGGTDKSRHRRLDGQDRQLEDRLQLDHVVPG